MIHEACDYCRLKDLMRDTLTRRAMTTVLKVGWRGGIDVLEVPEGEVANKNKHYVAWLPRLEDHCVC